ncbi:hypothetical protein ABZ442_17130 [Streptomyces triculaminicus]|uniref:hypothetical protein n=1 Tax=Streptomyces triculaminicus TaxID=2816232 RepID=UPI0033E95958
MHPIRLRRLAQQLRRTPCRVARWTAARRRAALGLVLRGTCYGTGTGLMSLLVYWLQHQR